MGKKAKKSLKIRQKLLIAVGGIVGLILLAAVALIVTLTVTEYKPAAEEELAIDSPENATGTLSSGSEFTLLSWNIGFAAQGEATDCFLDGGEDVIPTDEEGVQTNLAGIASVISGENPDFLFLQEVDTDSKRSHYQNEYQYFEEQFTDFSGTFALNYSTLYVPYPFPTTYGKVNAGLAVFSRQEIASAERISLPCSFSWPMSTVNLKRCLLVNRIPVEGTDKELVLVNLHLEAYDDGEGKAAQTKQLYELLQKEYDAGNYVIAAGDFNQTFSNCNISDYPVLGENWESPIIDTEDFGDNFNLFMDCSVPSCRSLDKVYQGANQDPSEFQYYMLDGFIVSDNIEIQEMRTLDEGFVYSDHNPIILRAVLQ